MSSTVHMVATHATEKVTGRWPPSMLREIAYGMSLLQPARPGGLDPVGASLLSASNPAAPPCRNLLASKAARALSILLRRLW
ncbi:hypothetical protein ABZP36_017158 [Zizania latifolia]